MSSASIPPSGNLFDGETIWRQPGSPTHFHKKSGGEPDLIKQSQFVRIASRKVHHHLKFMDAFFYWPLVATLTV